MSRGADLGHYILQTHNSEKNSEDSMGFEPLHLIPLLLGTPVHADHFWLIRLKVTLNKWSHTPICLLHFSIKLLVYYTIGLKRLFHHFTRCF